MRFEPVVRSKKFKEMDMDFLTDKITDFINTNNRIENILNISYYSCKEGDWDYYYGIVVFEYSLYKDGKLVDEYQQLVSGEVEF